MQLEAGKSKLSIGVLAVQGSFAVHRPHIEALGCNYIAVRDKESLKLCDGIILPGGESSTMLKLLDHLNLKDELISYLNKKPSWGICAGAILLSRQVRSPEQDSLNILDIEIERNSYGSQLNSFEAEIENMTVSFIRAPRIIELGKDIISKHKLHENSTWIRNNKTMATTFHPELSLNFPSFFHKYFLDELISN